MNGNRIGSVVVVIVMLLLLWWRFPDFFSHGNTRFIEPWGDGYKAYHAIFYHADFDSTYSHFEGMNYPYGEHVVPGACQPFFSNSLKALAAIGLDLRPYKLGLLHGFLLLGLVLCALFLYLIFVRLKLPPWYAAVAAIGLTMLAPQVERFVSHYGLAHPELLPIIIYLLLRWNERPHWGWSLTIGLVVWIYSLVHFYYFAVLTFAIVGWVGVRWLLRKDWRATPQYLGHGILMLGLPLLFFYFWMMYNDPVTDRNAVPWGFFTFRARVAGIFTDNVLPYWQWVNDRVVSLYAPNIESRSYIGLVAIAFIPLWLMVTRWDWMAKRIKFTPPAEKKQFLHYLMLSAGLILIFAFGIPFIIPGFDKFLKYAGPIQQFRSIGRFAWVFYYAVNIAAFYYLYQWISRGVNVKWQPWLLALPLLVLGYESYMYNTAKNLSLDEVENWAERERFTDLAIDYSQYQACVPIPYFNIGSGNFWWEPTGWISQKPHTLSMQTGLPLTSAMLTRTSLSQTLNQLQLVTEPYRVPKLLADLPNEKPLLLFWDNVRVHEHGQRFVHLNQRVSLLHEDDWMHLYEMPLESFTCRIADQLQGVRAHLDSLPRVADDWQVSDSTAQWLHITYDDQLRTDAYRGKGELSGHMGYWNRLVDTVWQANYTGELTISFWQYLNSDRSARTAISWIEYDAVIGEELFRQERNSRQVLQVLDGEGWGLIEFSLPRQKADSRIELIVRNDDYKEGPLRIDELLIRPAGVTIGQQRTDGWWYNNRWYPKSLASLETACN